MASKPGVLRIEPIGTRKILKKLDALPAKIRTKIIRKVISKGTTVMKREIVKRAPVGVDNNPTDDDGNPRKRLKKSITKRIAVAKGKTAIHGIVGIPSEFPRFVYMLHYGIKAHKIRAKDGGRLSFAGGVYRSVNHPGVKQMNFMREALAATIPKARSHMKGQLRLGLRSVAK